MLHIVTLSCNHFSHFQSPIYLNFLRVFPVQVRFSVIWNCHPLSERDFRDAIRENYFAAWKFNIGLSKDQVLLITSL